ncbi:MAG TPA: beta-propeller fold lactonase family protein [Longimicrobiales bacterium]
MMHGMKRASLALVAALAAVTACAAPALQSEAVAPAADRVLLYVCNQNDATVSVIDLATNRVIRTVDLQQLGFSANAKPHHVAVEPDGSYWYVTLIGDGRIVKLDSSDRIIAQVPFETPGMLALHPTEDLLFVGRSMTAVNPPQRIGILRRSDMLMNELPVFFPRPHAMALEPRSGTVYTASLGVNQMAAVDPASETVELIDVAGPAHALMQFAVSPDGRTLVISAELSHKVFVFDIAEPMKPRLTDEIDVGPQPFDPIFTPDGRWVYLGNKAANTVTVIDMTTRSVADVIRGQGLAQPHGIATSRDGRFVYVSNNNLGQTHDMAAHAAPAAPAQPAGNGTVVVIDTAAREIVSVIEVGHNASGIGTRTWRP